MSNYNFNLEGDDNKFYSLKDFKGKNLILYFYSKDNTSGWTKEAVEFNGLKEGFNKFDIIIVGVSRDSIERHKSFKEKKEFDLLLLSDPEKKAHIDFEVWAEKKMYGKTVMGVKRSTFLFDKKGNVIKEWRNVKAGGHAEKVLAYVQENLWIQIKNIE